MAEVCVIARFAARKGKEDQLRALLQSMLAPTHAESGCKLYELYESDSSGRFYFCETWESQAALDQHAATPHFKRLEQTAPELVKEPFEVNILKKILADQRGSRTCGIAREKVADANEALGEQTQ